MDKTLPITKFTLNDWIKHPTTILLIVVTCLAWAVLWIYVESKLAEVNYLKDRIVILESREAETQKELKSYVRTLLLKDAQIKELARIAKEVE